MGQNDLPPGATLVSGSIPDASQLPPGATLVSGSLPASSSDASNEGTGFWAHVGKSLRSMAPDDVPSFTDTLKQAGVSSLGPGYNAIQALHNAATEYASARQRGHGVPYSAAAGASTAVGVSPERMEEAANAGDTAGVLGEAAVPTAMALTPVGAEAVKATGVPSAFKGAIADIKPTIVSELDKTHSLSGRTIKALADQVLPGPTQAELEAQQASELAAQKAAAKQEAADRKAVPVSKSPTPGGYTGPAAARAAAKATANAEKSPIVTAASPEAESEGRPATWANLKVSELARQGGPLSFDAAKQAQLRQLNVPEVGLVADPRATVGADAIGSSADRLARLQALAAPALKGGPADFAKTQEPQYLYRIRPVGEEGVPAGAKNSLAQLTSSLDQAESWWDAKNADRPHEIIRVPISSLKQGQTSVREFSPGVDWHKVHQAIPESEVEVVHPHQAEAESE